MLMNADSLSLPRAILTLDQVSFSRSSHRKRQTFQRVEQGAALDYHLSQLSAQAYRGDIVALLGDSGVGKTSILRLLLGFEDLKQGQISWQGEVIQSPKHKQVSAQRGFAYVAQDALLFPHLNVIDNVCFGLKSRDEVHIHSEQKMLTPSEQIYCAKKILVDLGLDHLQEAWPKQLSGGQQKRVALARALALDAPLMLLDEPFSSLDMDLRQTLQATLFKQLKEKNTTVIWSTHDVDAALRYADYLWILEGPNQLVSGQSKQLYHSPPSRSVAERLGVFDYIPLKDLIAYNSSWAQLLEGESKKVLSSTIGLAPHGWSMYPPCTEIKQLDNQGQLSEVASSKITQPLQLTGRVVTIQRHITKLDISLELCLSNAHQHPSLLRTVQEQKVSHYKEVESLESDSISDVNKLKLRLDLPKSNLIRMTLASHLPILIGQTLKIYYLGELITLES